MSLVKRILIFLGLSSPASDESLLTALEGFDFYTQRLMSAVDPQWDGSTRMHNLEYCAFLHGASLAIARSYGREDADAVAILGSYLSHFMDQQFAVGWLLNCEAELSRSPRLQTVQAAGGNTVQAALAVSRGQSNVLSHPQNFQLLFEIFAEVRKLMNDRAASDECLFATSSIFYDAVVGA